MVEANIITVFVGIESPNEASLRETKKFQNVRAGGTMLEKVHRIQDAGMEVWCGMILGFDNDDETIFDAQREFIQEARIAISMIGMLCGDPQDAAVRPPGRGGPARPVRRARVRHQRHPLQISREELRDGYVRVMNDLYEPEAYFGRLDDSDHQGTARHGPGPLALLEAPSARTASSGRRSGWSSRSACSSG